MEPDGAPAFDRVPPNDLEAEQSVLGGMMLSKDAIADVIEELRETDFYRPAHETIFGAIIDLFGRGDPADAVTVAAELTKRGELQKIGGAPYLHTLISSVPTAANASYYARIVAERATMRRLVQAGTRVVQLGYSAAGDEVDEIVNQAQAEVYAITENRGGNDYVPIGETLSPTVAELAELGKRGKGLRGLATGFKGLDGLTQGLHPGQMIIVAARPAMGKSTLAIDFCRSAAIAHGVTAAVFSLEMSRNELTTRILAAEARVNMSALKSGDIDSAQWGRIAKAMNRLGDKPLYIDDSPNMTIPEIRAKCRRLKQQHNLGLVVIDYLQLMTSGRRVESRQQEVSDFSRALKLLAKELELPVVAVAQLNRGPEQRGDKKPLIADLRESGSLEQDADVIMLLHRPSYYEENDRPGEADIHVAKHRNGETAILTVAFQGQYSRFQDMAHQPEPPM